MRVVVGNNNQTIGSITSVPNKEFRVTVTNIADDTSTELVHETFTAAENKIYSNKFVGLVLDRYFLYQKTAAVTSGNSIVTQPTYEQYDMTTGIITQLSLAIVTR